MDPHSVSPDFVSEQVLESRYTFGDLAPSSSERFIMTCAGRETCKPDYHLRRDGFVFYAVEFIFSGRWELLIGDLRYELGPGSVFGYRPDSVFEIRALGKETQTKYFVDFAGVKAASALENAGLLQMEPMVVLPTRSIQELFDQILDCQDYPKQAVLEMGTMLTRLLLMRIGLDGRAPSGASRDSFETFQRCREYIRENFLMLNSIAEVSEACHVDRAYLSRLFKKHMDESPYQLLTRLKMEFAAEYLLNKSFSVKQVAHEVGFEDPFHFSRVFKKLRTLAEKFAEGRGRIAD